MARASGSERSAVSFDRQDGDRTIEQEPLGDAAQQGLAHRRAALHPDDETLDVGTLLDLVEHGVGRVAVLRAAALEKSDLEVLGQARDVEGAQGHVEDDEVGVEQLSFGGPGEEGLRALPPLGDCDEHGHGILLPEVGRERQEYWWRNCSSSCSSERPRVSGTRRYTNTRASR